MGAAGLGLAVRLAGRELRSGLRGFGVFLGCLWLGVFAIAAVGSVSAAARQGILADARGILGGDLELSLTHRPAGEGVLSQPPDRAFPKQSAQCRSGEIPDL